MAPRATELMLEEYANAELEKIFDRLELLNNLKASVDRDAVITPPESFKLEESLKALKNV